MPEPWIEGTLGREVEPRPGFEEELAGDLAAAWRGDAPAVSVRPVRRAPRRPSTWWLVAAAVLVVAIVVVVSTRVRSTPRPMGPTPTPPVPATTVPTTTGPDVATTVAPATTAAVTTAAVIVTPTNATPTPTAVAATIAPDPNHADGFDPPCVESRRGGAVPSANEAALEHFGPLASAPMATLTLPVAWSAGEPLPAAAQVTRIPGGQLVAVASSDFAFSASMVAAVDDDGTTRWVRCFADRANTVVAPPASSNPQTALVQLGHDPGQGAQWTAAWQVIDLATGAVRTSLADLLAAAGTDPAPFDNNELPVVVDDDEVVLGPRQDTTIDVARDRLLRLDLRTLTPTLVPFPAAADGQGMFSLRFGHNADGALALVRSPAGNPPVVAAFVNGSWSTAADDTLAYRGVRADYPLDGGFDAVLEGRDGHGNVVWRNESVTSGDIGEGFRSAVDGDLTVVASCLGTYDLQTGCPNQGLVGVRNRDGAVLWQLPGRPGVAAIGDGHALVVGPVGPLPDGTTGVAGWSMIDTSTGQDIPGQRWTDTATFEIECCGGDAAVTRDGAILAAINNGRVTLWFPASVPPAGAQTALP